MSFARNWLRTSTIHINSNHILFNKTGSFQHNLGIVTGKLSNERSFSTLVIKTLSLIREVIQKHFRMNHWSVTQICIIIPCKFSKCIFR